VDGAYRPSAFEVEANLYAVQSHRDHERYGLPYPGALLDQPHLWKLAVDCVAEAQAHGGALGASRGREERTAAEAEW